MPARDPESIVVRPGSWMRRRWISTPRRRARVGPAHEWSGLWHLATGYTTEARGWPDGQRVIARCGCGIDAYLEFSYDGLPIADVVSSDELPTVDVCTRCIRLSGLPVTIRIRPRKVTIIRADADAIQSPREGR